MICFRIRILHVNLRISYNYQILPIYRKLLIHELTARVNFKLWFRKD